MAILFRFMVRVFFVFLIIAALAFLFVWFVAKRSLPDYDADHVVSGLHGEVEIVRDIRSLPHIFAEDDRDLYFGLGFAHAQDRLWQMIMLRRTGQGRLSEFFGERTLPVDDFVRRFDLYELSRASLQYQTDDTKMALSSYAAGVNAWLRIVHDEAKGRGAPEFFLFSGEIAPWTPADSLLILRLMNLKLSSHLKAEILRARTSLAIGSDRLKDILPDAPGTGVVGLPEYSELFPGLKDRPVQLAAKPPFLDPLPAPDMAGASNAWAAATKRTATGAPILANDPHLGLTAPSYFMLARMEFSDGGVIGGSIPGIPAILVGRSANFGWGVTSSYLDDVDLYVEQLNPENPAEYLTPDGYKPFEAKDVIIQVKDAETRKLQLRWTENGPVLPSDIYDLDQITPRGHVMSAAWTALIEADRSMSGTIGVMRAKSVSEARRAAAMVAGPSQNLILADQNSVAQLLTGKMPRRNKDHASKGRIPSQGWLERNRWEGFFPASQNLYVRNPAGGIVANTNNKLTDKPFPDHVSYLWGDSQRIKRLTKLMNERKVHTRESFVEAQLDPVSITARTLLPLVARDLWFQGQSAPEGSREARQQTALRLLAEWNGEMSEHLPEPLIYAAWMRHLQLRLIRDDLGPLASEFSRMGPVFIERVMRNVDGAGQWCDIRQSTTEETCLDMARLALDDALAELSARYGDTIESWRWGRAHQAQHKHEVLGDIPVLSWFANIFQETSGGDNTLRRGRTPGTGPDPYANVHAGVYRGIYDFGDPDSSLFIISTGQSGHPFSPYYDDLAQLWRRGEYIPMSLDPDLPRAAAVGITKLQPEQP